MSKGLIPPVLAQWWENDLGTRPDMSIKVERKLHDMRIIGVDCESAKRVAIRAIQKVTKNKGKKSEKDSRRIIKE